MDSPTPPLKEYLEPVAACATSAGIGGIAIVRLSGRNAQSIALRLLPASASLPSAKRCFFHTHLHHPLTGKPLDEAVLLSFPAPHSYTGEPVVEFQVHGGRIPAQRVLEALSCLGVRAALPGEFTRRAFLNGRLDLTAAEAVLDLIGAEASRSADAALAQLNGGLRQRITPLYQDLVALRADVEASLDFEETDVPDSLSPEALNPRVKQVLLGISDLLSTWHDGHLLREGALVVIAGRPNAGKSSLFNALLATDRAIVSDEPGTTRDLLEESFHLDGIPLRLVDTAGLRNATGIVEQQGVHRAKAELLRADLRLLVIDASAPFPEQTLAELLGSTPLSIPTLAVFNKIDLVSSFSTPPLPPSCQAVCTSALSSEGLPALREALREALGTASPSLSENTGVAVNERHRGLLEEAKASLLEALDGLTPSNSTFDAVLIAQCLRAATESLGAITGANSSEDMLDAIFSRFCIGK